ncbi:hypothetical protein ACDT17_00155 [Chromobacterium piscinae]|uniref:nucleotide-binding protein n=1 Tax=Chromobacterium piscinae TaxID=686831 RepID=UPI003558BA61
MTPRSCPALFLTAPASHQGKTTVTAALARHHRNLGRRVRVFKTGPDFLDPYILERASGHTVYGLDLWMNGEDDCRARLHQAAGDADLILVEGSMGLFDGTPSSADLATLLGIPLAAVIDAAGMAQTFAAVAHGLASFRPGLAFHGFIANHVASERHADMLAQQLPPHPPLLAALRRDEAARLPETPSGSGAGAGNRRPRRPSRPRGVADRRHRAGRIAAACGVSRRQADRMAATAGWQTHRHRPRRRLRLRLSG